MRLFAKLGELATVLRLTDIRCERSGYLSTYSFQIPGVPHRHECVDRGRDAVLVLPVDWGRRVLYLVRQARPVTAFGTEFARSVLRNVAARGGSLTADAEQVTTFDVPAGMIDDGESPIQAAVREVLEETGFVLDASALVPVENCTVSAGSSTERHISFLAAVTAATPWRQPVGDGTENIETYEMTFDEAFAVTKSGTSRHSTLAMLLREVELRDLRRRYDDLVASIDSTQVS